MREKGVENPFIKDARIQFTSYRRLREDDLKGSLRTV